MYGGARYTVMTVLLGLEYQNAELISDSLRHWYGPRIDGNTVSKHWGNNYDHISEVKTYTNKTGGWRSFEYDGRPAKRLLQ